MFCEKCGKPFEGEGTKCPECAAETAATVLPQPPVAEQSDVLPPVFEAENTQSCLADQPAEPVTQQSCLDPQAAEAAEEPTEEEPFTLSAPAAPVKKKFNFKIFGIVAAVLALVGGACFFFFGTDTGRYMTSSPEEYLQDVQQEQVSTYIDGASAVYGALLNSSSDSSLAYNGEIRIQVSDALLEMASSYGVDTAELQWLKDIRLSTSSNLVGTTLQSKMNLGLGSTEILQTDVIMDMMTSRMYMALPGLNSQYLAAAMPDSGGINVAQANAAIEKLREQLPSEKAFNEMLDGLAEVALAQITNVQKAEETVMVGGVAEEQHVLTATLTEADLIRMLSAVLEKAQTDATFLELVAAINTYANMLGAGVDLNTEFVTQIPVLIAQLNAQANTATSGETIVIKTYVNHSGVITGRIVTLFSSGPAQELLNYMSATDDGVTASQGTFRNVSYTGKTQTTGKVTTSNYSVYVESEEMVKLDIIKTKNQSTEYRLSPGSGLMTQLMGAIGGEAEESVDSEAGVSSAASPLAGLLAGSGSISLTVSDPDSDNPSIALSAQFGGQSLFTITLSGKQSDAQSISIPSSYVDIEDAEALDAWLDALDFEGLLNKLRSAGVPEEFISMIEDGLPMAEESVDVEALPAA